MPDFQKNLWAPWRMAYIRTLAEESDEGCFLCQYAAASNDDAAHHVIRRTDGMMVLLNRYPYSNGHLMIAPLAHKANLADLSAAEMSDSMQLLIETQDALRACVHAQGFNIGMNVGPCAGAGVPDHLHWHVVPRWGGDTNYMSVVGDARVIPDALEAVYQSMRAWWRNRDAAGSDANGS